MLISNKKLLKHCYDLAWHQPEQISSCGTEKLDCFSFSSYFQRGYKSVDSLKCQCFDVIGVIDDDLTNTHRASVLTFGE